MLHAGIKTARIAEKKTTTALAAHFFFLSENVAMVTAVYPKVWDQSV